MSLSVDPPTIMVASDGGVSQHNLINASTMRLAFKIKSTNNDHYRLKPVYGFIEPNASAAIEVTRLRGPPKEDKLVIMYLEAPVDATDACALFKESTPLGDVDLPINAA